MARRLSLAAPAAHSTLDEADDRLISPYLPCSPPLLPPFPTPPTPGVQIVRFREDGVIRTLSTEGSITTTNLHFHVYENVTLAMAAKEGIHVKKDEVRVRYCGYRCRRRDKCIGLRVCMQWE